MVTLVGSRFLGCRQSGQTVCVKARNSRLVAGYTNRRQVVVVAAAKKPKKVNNGEEDSEQVKRAREVAQIINEKYGKGTAVVFGQEVPDVHRLSTGDLYLDWALSGGYAKGRIVEIYGPSSAGKSTMSLLAVAEAQKQGQLAAYIDVENSFDPRYAAKFGVNVRELALINGSECGETALNTVDELTRAGVGLIVVDSVSALVPRVELSGKIEDIQVGLQARMMSKALRSITPNVNKANTVLIFINQLRSKIGTYGNPEITSGGAALTYYASQRIDVRALKGDVIHSKENKDQVIGQKIRCRVTKNKVGFPMREAYVHHYFGHGMDRTASLIDACIKLGIVKKTGSWYAFGAKKALGLDKFKEQIKQAPEMELGLIKALQDCYVHDVSEIDGSGDDAEEEKEEVVSQEASEDESA